MISTHVLDTSLGCPAAGVRVELTRQSGATWAAVSAGETSGDGRFVFTCPAEAGTYRLLFKTGDYLKKKKTDQNNDQIFFPQVEVVMSITDLNRKYHIPLLLSPFGYSTYRGS